MPANNWDGDGTRKTEVAELLSDEGRGADDIECRHTEHSVRQTHQHLLTNLARDIGGKALTAWAQTPYAA